MPRAALSEQAIRSFREEACRVATRQFAERGYEGMTVRGLAAALGVSPMTPYRYFPGGKDEILAAVRATGYRRLAEAQETALAEQEAPDARLSASGRAYLGFALAEPDLYRVMFELTQEAEGAYPELEAQAGRAWLPLRIAIGDCVDAGVVGGDRDTLTHVFWAGLHGIISLHLAGKLTKGRTIDNLIRPMMLTLYLGNLPADPARRPPT